MRAQQSSNWRLRMSPALNDFIDGLVAFYRLRRPLADAVRHGFTSRRIVPPQPRPTASKGRGRLRRLVIAAHWKADR